MRVLRCLAICGLLSLAGCGGCRSETYTTFIPTKGKVVWADGKDSKDLVGWNLLAVFANGRGAYGPIQKDGSFSLVWAGKEGLQEGMPPGGCRVYLNSQDTLRVGNPPMLEKYLHPKTSGLTLAVAEGQSEAVFTIERRDKNQKSSTASVLEEDPNK